MNRLACILLCTLGVTLWTACSGTTTPVGEQSSAGGAAGKDGSAGSAGQGGSSGSAGQGGSAGSAGDPDGGSFCSSTADCSPTQWCNFEPAGKGMCSTGGKMGVCEARPDPKLCPVYDICPDACGCNGSIFCDDCRAHAAGVPTTSDNKWCKLDAGPTDSGKQVCTPGLTPSCNGNLEVSAIQGECQDDGTCKCNGAYQLDPYTGLCVYPKDAGSSVCSPGDSLGCNGNPQVSSIQGECQADGTCKCYGVNLSDPLTGLCVLP